MATPGLLNLQSSLVVLVFIIIIVLDLVAVRPIHPRPQPKRSPACCSIRRIVRGNDLGLVPPRRAVLDTDSADFLGDVSDDVQEIGVVRRLPGRINLQGSVRVGIAPSLLGEFGHAGEQVAS